MKPVRHNSILPHEPEKMLAAQVINDWHENMWVEWGLDPSVEGDLMLLAYCSLLIDTGLPHSSAIDVLATVKASERIIFDCVAIQAQRFERSERQTIINLSRRSRIAVDGWKQHWPTPPISWLRLSQKFRAENVMNSITKAFVKHAKLNKQLSMICFGEVSGLAKVIACHRVFDPYLVTVYDGTIRPTDEDPLDTYSMLGVAQEYRSHLIVNKDRSLPPNIHLQPGDICLDSFVDVKSEWATNAKRLLRSLCQELEEQVLAAM